MKNEDLKNYISILLHDTDVSDKILPETVNIMLILKAYIAGINKENMSIGLFLDEPLIDKSIPAEFHTLVAKGAILKTKKTFNISSATKSYLGKDVDKSLQDFCNYFMNIK
jgi:hypothetical protein